MSEKIEYFDFSPKIRVAYEERGSSGPSLVFLHGFGASRETWNDVTPVLTDKARLFLLDLMGFGLSSKPEGVEYSIAMHATIVAQFMRSLGIQDVTLVGHSYGGGVALRTYLDHERAPIRRMILLDAAGYRQPLPFFVGSLRVPLLNYLILNFIPPDVRAAITLKHLFYSAEAVTRERIRRYSKYFDIPGAHRSYVAAARHVVPADHGDIVDRIPTIDVPTLIIWGRNDAAIDVGNARRFARDIPKSELRVLEHCGHIPHEEKPTQTAAAILEFVLD